MEPRARTLRGIVAEAVAALDEEVDEAEDIIFLTGFENRPSELVERVSASRLSRRYHLGISTDRLPGEVVLHGRLMARGLQSVQHLEQLAQTHACAMFGAAHTDFRVLTGLHAVSCTLGILTEPGAVVYSLSPHDGGHFATEQLVRRLGRRSRFLPDRVGWRRWDADALASAFGSARPSAILVDCGIQLAPLELLALREVAGPACTILFDASHTLGLIAGGLHDSPLGAGADVVQGNTHKSFFGPHRAMVLFRDAAIGRHFSRALGEAFVSSQLTSVATALYLAVLEMAAFGQDYARQVVANANLLAAALHRRGWSVAELDSGRFTETNILLVDRAGDRGPYEAYQSLSAGGIVTNARPFRAKSVLRIGVQEVTRLGFDGTALDTLAGLMDESVRDPASAPSIRRRVRDLSRAFRTVHYAFDADPDKPASPRKKGRS